MQLLESSLSMEMDLTLFKFRLHQTCLWVLVICNSPAYYMTYYMTQNTVCCEKLGDLVMLVVHPAV